MKTSRIVFLGGCFALLAAAPAVAEQTQLDHLPYFRYAAPVAAAPEPLLATLAGACLAGAALLRRRR